MTIHWEAVEQYFTEVFGFQFYPVCNFEKFKTFMLGHFHFDTVLRFHDIRRALLNFNIEAYIIFFRWSFVCG